MPKLEPLDVVSLLKGWQSSAASLNVLFVSADASVRVAFTGAVVVAGEEGFTLGSTIGFEGARLEVPVSALVGGIAMTGSGSEFEALGYAVKKDDGVAKIYSIFFHAGGSLRIVEHDPSNKTVEQVDGAGAEHRVLAVALERISATLASE